jgi:hypothetical protein
MFTAAAVQANAAPPSSVMNSRRSILVLTRSPRRPAPAICLES